MSASEHAAMDDGVPLALEGEALEQALTKQIEYYFSRENLQQDAYLVQQMNAELFVPIGVIAQFKKVAQLTPDIEIVKKVMRSSNVVKMNENETMVRPNLKTERNTIILREIPSETPVEEVQAIFASDKCGEVKEIRPDLGDTWFIKFENEEATMKTFQFLQNAKFQDKPIRCRIKAENPLRNLNNPHVAAPPPMDMGPAMAPYYQPTMGYMPNMYGYAPAGYMYPPPPYADPFVNGGFAPAPFKQQTFPAAGQRGGRGAAAPGAAKGGRGGTGRSFNNQPAAAGAASKPAADAAAARGPRGAATATKAPRQLTAGQKKPETRSNIQLHEPSHFPPLPTAKGGKSPKSSTAPEDFGFVKLSRSDICDIIRSLPPPSRPELPEAAGSIALDTPLLELETMKEAPAAAAPVATSPPVASSVPAEGAGGNKKKKPAAASGGNAKEKGRKEKDAAPAKADDDAAGDDAAEPEASAPVPAPAPAAKGKGGRGGKGKEGGGKKGGKDKDQGGKDKQDEKPSTPPSPARGGGGGKSYADIIKANKEKEAAARAAAGK